MSNGHPIDPEMLESARTTVRASFGADLADKASPEFLMSLSRSLPRAPGDFALEAVAAATPTAPATVVEFAPTDVAERVTRRTALPREAFDGLRGALEGVGRIEEVARLDPSIVARDLSVRTLREAFHLQAGAVADELERAGGSSLRPGVEAATPGGPAPITHTCWLNRTIRTAADPLTLANVAADRSIQRVDVPRRLEAELDQTSAVVGAPEFRRTSGATGQGIIVAVIDQEVLLNHPALLNRVIHRRNYTTEPWGNPGPHGTGVAGIVAANGDLVGMAPDATIYNYKVLATVPAADADDFFGWRAVQDALEDGAHVANCSWKDAGPADGTSRGVVAFDTAWGLGLVIVKSAGNVGPGAGTITPPGEADGAIVVGATDRTGSAVESYSARGPAFDGDERPHLVAPGGSPSDGMISLTVDGATGGIGHGTSYAAPHVAGLVALLLQLEPELTPDAIRQKLIDACQPLARIDANTQGAGLVKL